MGDNRGIQATTNVMLKTLRYAWSLIRKRPLHALAALFLFVYIITVGGYSLALSGFTEVSMGNTALTPLCSEEKQAIAGEIPADISRPGEKEESLPLGLAILDFLDSVTPAVEILVEGQPVVAVPSPGDAKEVIERVELSFVHESDSITLLESSIVEDVTYRTGVAKLAEIKSVDKAVAVLLQGTDRLEKYTVRRGDSLWGIANKSGTTVSELTQANPGINPDLIRIGQELNLVVPEPYVHINTVEMRTYHEHVAYHTEVTYDSSLWYWESYVKRSGIPGSNRVKARITSLNGEEQNREIVSRVRERDPVSRIIVRGTKQAPSRGTGQFLWPLKTGKISSPYGWRWLRGRRDFHRAVDIAAPTGTKVSAADSGVVSFAGLSSGYGLMVRIEHGNGVSTVYGHNSKLLVSENDIVKKGQLISLVGNTGNSTGPHLHFEIRINNEPVDPLRYFN